MSVPDGRCGIAYVRGQLWWLGPASLPWSATRVSGEVIGVRLHFSAGRAAAGEPPRRWRDRRVVLSTIWNAKVVSDLAARMAQANDLADGVKTLGEAIATCSGFTADGSGPTEGLAEQVAAGASVAELARGLGISARHVNRRFDDLFGMPPTVLRRILRLHRAARQRAQSPYLALTDVAAAAGYADHAHLSRDSRALTMSAAGVALAYY